MKEHRLWEIDSLRGVAIILMVFFNYAFTLRYFGIYTIGGGWVFWWLFPRLVAGIFIFLVGLSLTLSYSRFRHNPKNGLYKKYLFRGLKIFGYGLFITLVTWFYLGKDFIIFGILHLIGISIILSYPLLRYSFFNFLLGMVLIITGLILSNFRFDFPWLLWLGLLPNNFYSVDYFPVLPWFGVTLIGIAFGNLFYRDGIRRFRLINIPNFPFVKPFSFLGRYSLLIYLIHQPILVALLYLFGLI